MTTRDVIMNRLALNASVGSKYQEFLHPRLKGKWRSKGAPPAATAPPRSQKGKEAMEPSPGGAKPSETISPAAQPTSGAQSQAPTGQAAPAAIQQQPEQKPAAGVGFSMTKVEGGARTLEDGSPIPDHAAKLKIPPAWTNVVIAQNKDADLLARGSDAKGRVQSIYSDAHWTKAAAAKFARTQELLAKREAIIKENNVNRTDPAKREEADVMALILQTGIRPGSDKDTGAKVKAHGATTLEGRHVTVTGGKVRLRFVGKKGVSLDIPVGDPELAEMLKERKKAAGGSGRLFATDASKLLDYAHSLDGGKFKTKDFRTLVGTKTAIEEVAKVQGKPKTQKDYVKQVKAVARIVAEKLGNTATVALQSYIDPSVFSAWRVAA